MSVVIFVCASCIGNACVGGAEVVVIAIQETCGDLAESPQAGFTKGTKVPIIAIDFREGDHAPDRRKARLVRAGIVIVAVEGKRCGSAIRVFALI